MEISAALIKELKEKTGAGIVDCKAILQETSGDLNKAIDILRKKGLNKADKKAGRAANEGTVVYKADGKKGLVLKVNCETDFVAKTEDFKKFTTEALDLIFQKGYTFSAELPADLEELRRNVIAKVGENILLSDWKFISGKGEFYPYVHLGKVAVIADFDGASASDEVKQMMKNIAMQITAMKPVAVNVESIPADTLSEIKAQYTEEAKQTGKPEKVLENIVKGKLEKYYNETILLEQAFILDEEKKVKTAIEEFNKGKGASLKVNSFVRVSL